MRVLGPMGPGFFIFFPKQYIRAAPSKPFKKAMVEKRPKEIKKVARKWAKKVGSESDIFRIQQVYELPKREAFEHYVDLIVDEIQQAIKQDDEAMLMIIFSL